MVCEPDEVYGSPNKQRLLDLVRQAMRARPYSPRTEEAYIGWVRRYILFHGKRQPDGMAEPEINVLQRGGRGVKSPADDL